MEQITKIRCLSFSVKGVNQIRNLAKKYQFFQVTTLKLIQNIIKKAPMKQIQLTITEAANRQDIHEEQSSQNKSRSNDIEGSNESKRRPQKLWMYVLCMLSQIITIFLSILLAVFPEPEQKRWVYLTFIVLTPVRCLIFFRNSYQLVGFNKKLIQLYVLLDNTFLMAISSVITYTFLNYNITVQYALGALICYPILLLFLIGNFRVMLLYCNWSPPQVIIYKLIKIIGSTYFLLYGTFLIIKTDDNTQSDLFMLWVFTTCGFWGEMFFCVNSFDQSDTLSTKYRLMDD